MTMENILCDFCNFSKHAVFLDRLTDNYLGLDGIFSLVKCSECGLVFLNPRPDKQEITRYYPDSYVPYNPESEILSSLKKLAWRVERKIIQDLLPSKGVILEIGSGRGDFLDYLKNGFDLYGLEMDAVAAQRARDLYKLTIWNETIENFDPTSHKFNLIILRYVLEHLQSPSTAFLKMKKMLKPQGYVYFSIPNIDSWEFRIFKKYWHGLDIPRHFYFFNKDSIEKYAQKFGFKIIGIHYSLIPNDWIGGLQRYWKEKGWFRMEKFFTTGNIFLLALFLPLSIVSYFFKKSSRFTFILQSI